MRKANIIRAQNKPIHLSADKGKDFSWKKIN
jgi:hypothetical protein